MSGSRIGGLKTVKANIEREPGFYTRIGKMGGSKTGKKGFALMSPAKRRAAGRLGGTNSKRSRDRLVNL